MFDNAIVHKKLPFRTVLMDSWYATLDLTKHIHRANKHFYCPLKSNRNVDDSQVKEPYKAVSALQWSGQEHAHGKVVKLFKFPADIKLKLFRVWWIPIERTGRDERTGSGFNGRYHKMYAVRWKI